jgi:hypothetical protein
MLVFFGSLFFLVIIALGVINTIFLVREIRRNEQHDSFINAVTHELKTPVASIRLYLQTLQSRDLDEAKRRDFYRIMLEDSDRLLHTIDQVLRAGATGSILRHSTPVRLDPGRSPPSRRTWRARAFIGTDAHARVRTKPRSSGERRRAEGGRLESHRQRRQVFAGRTEDPRGAGRGARERPGRGPRDR